MLLDSLLLRPWPVWRCFLCLMMVVPVELLPMAAALSLGAAGAAVPLSSPVVLGAAGFVVVWVSVVLVVCARAPNAETARTSALMAMIFT